MGGSRRPRSASWRARHSARLRAKTPGGIEFLQALQHPLHPPGLEPQALRDLRRLQGQIAPLVQRLDQGLADRPVLSIGQIGAELAHEMLLQAERRRGGIGGRIARTPLAALAPAVARDAGEEAVQRRGQGPGGRQAGTRLLGLLQPGQGLLGQIGGGLQQRVLRHGLGQEIGQLEIGEAEQLDRLLLGGGQPGGEPLHLPRRCMLTEAGAELHHRSDPRG